MKPCEECQSLDFHVVHDEDGARVCSDCGWPQNRPGARGEGGRLCGSCVAGMGTSYVDDQTGLVHTPDCRVCGGTGIVLGLGAEEAMAQQVNDMLAKVVSALSVPGPHPDLHWRTRARHGREWPTLHRALDLLEQAYRAQQELHSKDS